MSAAPILDAKDTARCLPYGALADECERVLHDPQVRVPERLVQPLPGNGSLFVMPALDARVAMTKLITLTPANAGTERPAIQGDVVVFDIATGARVLTLDGPTVTARRTAAASLLAARRLAPTRRGRALIIGAGVQARAHLEAFAEGLGTHDFLIASRSRESARALARHAQTLGLDAGVVTDANAALADCTLVACCTPAHAIVLEALPQADTFIAAVGSFAPAMAELGAALCQHIARTGDIWLDAEQAREEAGDLIQAGLDPHRFSTLRSLSEVGSQHATGPVLFKSCGWAGWDLAAARLASMQAGAH